jgi:hypothetical protein
VSSKFYAGILHHEEKTLDFPWGSAGFFICCKSYDIEWRDDDDQAKPAKESLVATLENFINQGRISDIIGRGETVGCIANGIAINT